MLSRQLLSGVAKGDFMRTFIAVNLDSRLKTELSRFQEDLKKEVVGVKWVKPELLHITLKFLGEIEEKAISQLEVPLNTLAKERASFQVHFSGLGAFPSTSRPRVIWIGTEKGAEELAGLAKEVERAVRKLQLPGVKEDRKDFVPHLTLGRARKNERPSLPERVLSRRWECSIPLWVDRFVLMRSDLKPGGPVYTPIKEFLLQ